MKKLIIGLLLLSVNLSLCNNYKKSIENIIDYYINYEIKEKKIEKKEIILHVVILYKDGNYMLNLGYFPSNKKDILLADANLYKYKGYKTSLNLIRVKNNRIVKMFKHIKNKSTILNEKVPHKVEPEKKWLVQLNKDNQVYEFETDNDKFHYQNLKEIVLFSNDYKAKLGR